MRKVSAVLGVNPAARTPIVATPEMYRAHGTVELMVAADAADGAARARNRTAPPSAVRREAKWHLQGRGRDGTAAGEVSGGWGDEKPTWSGPRPPATLAAGVSGRA